MSRDDPAPDDHLHVRVFNSHNIVIDSKTWVTYEPGSPFWRLYVNAQDGADPIMADGPFPLAAKRIHFIPAWIPFTCCARAPVEHLYISFDVIGIPGGVVRDCFSKPFTLPEDPVLESIAERLRPQLSGMPSTDPAILCLSKALVFSSLSHLFAQLPNDMLARVLRFVRGRNPVAPALKRIDERLSEPQMNAQLATCCGLGEDHFIRVFRQHVGQTPAQYVLERRIAAAGERLQFSHLSITDIAEDCGFPNRYYFTRVFTRRMGMSPAKYRRFKLN